MKRQIVIAVLGAVLLLVPATTRARWMNPDKGRFQTMDTYEGNNSEPQSLHKYLYAQGNPVDAVDPTGLTIWVCTRRTVDFPCTGWGIGRHAYLWDDRLATNVTYRSVSMQEPYRFSGDPGNTSERSEKGPFRSAEDGVPTAGVAYVDTVLDVEGYPVPGTQGLEDKIMLRAHNIANAQIFDPPIWDCHTAVDRILADAKLPLVPHRKCNNFYERAALGAYVMGRRFAVSALSSTPLVPVPMVQLLNAL